MDRTPSTRLATTYKLLHLHSSLNILRTAVFVWMVFNTYRLYRVGRHRKGNQLRWLGIENNAQCTMFNILLYSKVGELSSKIVLVPKYVA